MFEQTERSHKRDTRSLPSFLAAAAAVLSLCGCGVRLGITPNLTVASVKDLGTIPTNPDILGRDGGDSAAFQGSSVWLYGDTFLARPNAGNFTLISDSWSYTGDLDASGGIAGFQRNAARRRRSGRPRAITASNRHARRKDSIL